MKILLAGAAGYVGQNLIPVLSERGHEVVGLDIRASELDSQAESLSSIVDVDLTKPELVAGTCEGIDTVISTVGLEIPRKDLDYWDVDYGANLNLLREAERAGVKKFLYISAIHADRVAEQPPMLLAKREFEHRLTRSKLDWVVFRPTGYFKDIVNIFMRMARKGKIRLVGDGEMRTNPLHPNDFAEFIADHLDAVNVVESVGGPRDYSYNELAELAFSALGKNPRVSHMSPQAFTAFMQVMRLIKPVKYPLLQFTLWCMTNDMVAPGIGSHSIGDELTAAAQA